MRFMHLSDVHLGVLPDTGKSWSRKRAQDIWDTFAETIEQAARMQPDFSSMSRSMTQPRLLQVRILMTSFWRNSSRRMGTPETDFCSYIFREWGIQDFFVDTFWKIRYTQVWEEV